MCNSYTPLHLHTEYSPDGIGNLDTLIDRASELDFKSIAITDHGSASGYISFYQACIDRNIKPIFGNEMYYKEHDFEERNHITILAKNQTGYENIIELNNAAHRNIELNRFKNKFPIVTMEMIERYSTGLIILTGCVQSRIFDSEYKNGLIYTKQLMRCVGENNVFLELMYVNHKDMQNNERIHAIQNDTKLPIVLTGDCHFAQKEHSSIHQIGTTARKGYTYQSSELYLKSYDEMMNDATAFISLPQAQEYLDNTNKVAEQIETFDITSEPTLPHVEQNELDNFEQFLDDKFNELPNSNKKVYKDRYKLEKDVIISKGFLSYFYITNDLKQYADDNDILVRLRGSGAGCLILYVMGVSPIDPIKYGLRFDRFLNYEREDYPDVDLDWEVNRREEVLKYAEERWGMLPMVALQKFSHKSLVEKLCIAFRKLFKADIPFELEHGARGGTDTLEWQQLVDKYPLFDKAYDVMYGQVSHIGKHAAAIAAPVVNCPIEFYGNEPAIAWNKNDGEDSGLVKIDMLGVKALDKISECRRLSGARINPETPFDEKIKDIFWNGNTNGIFQFKSKQAIELGKQIKPTELEHTTAIISLNRPGTLDAGTAELYAEFKKKPRKIEKRIDKILKATYGIILYQEDVMNVFVTVTNGDSSMANRARKILCPKSPKATLDPKWIAQKDELKEIFFTEGLKNNFTQKVLDFLWNEMKAHRRYSFNKSHGASYAYNGYEEAWYKAHYPEVYWTCQLRHTPNSKDNASIIQSFLIDAHKAGLEITAPHVNISSYQYELEVNGQMITPDSNILDNTFEIGPNRLYLPITMIKGIGEDKCRQLYEKRLVLGKFHTLTDFIENTDGLLNKRQRRHLFELGCLDRINGNYGKLFFSEIEKLEKKLDNCDSIIERLFRTQQINNKDSTHLQDKLTVKQFERVEEGVELIKNYHDMTKRDLQRDYLGFVLPDEKTIALLNKYEDYEHIVVGWIVEANKKKTKNDNDIISYKVAPQNHFWEPRNSMYPKHQQRVDNGDLQHVLDGKGNDFSIGTFIVVQKDRNRDGTDFGMLGKFLILTDE